MSSLDPALLETIRVAIARVPDPEFGLSVADLGLIRSLRCDAGHATIEMTLTSMYCPAGDVILAGVKSAAESVPGVSEATVLLGWEPLWTPDDLSEAGRRHLGWDVPRTPA